MDARKRTTMKVVVSCLLVLLAMTSSVLAGDTPAGPDISSWWGFTGDYVFLALVLAGWITV